MVYPGPILSTFKKNEPIPASFCLFSLFFRYNFNNINWKKRRWSAINIFCVKLRYAIFTRLIGCSKLLTNQNTLYNIFRTWLGGGGGGLKLSDRGFEAKSKCRTQKIMSNRKFNAVRIRTPFHTGNFSIKSNYQTNICWHLMALHRSYQVKQV